MNIKSIVLAALLITLGVVLPVGFHYFIPGSGTILSPMHIPVFLSGAIMGPLGGFLVGLITPILSSIFTGMPPVLPILPIMAAELPVYGLVIGYIYKNKGFNIYIALIISMFAGRVMTGLVVSVMVYALNFSNLPANPLLFVWGSVIKGLPGIILHLIIVPLFIGYLRNYINNASPEYKSY